MFIRNNLRLNSWRRKVNKQIELPTDFSKRLPKPKYTVGDHCRWIPMPETDWGTVMGFVYAPDHSSDYLNSNCTWIYLLLLDVNSPSREWAEADWVEEEDLELFDPLISSSTSPDEKKV